MRFREVSPGADALVEISRPNSRREADTLLRSAGYRRMGRGAFAAVYEKAGLPYVLKVFSANDAAFLAFHALAVAHTDNPHFPRYHGKIVTVTQTYRAVRMEKLAPYRYDPTLISFYMKTRDYVPENPESFYAHRMSDANELMEEYPLLRRACDLIIDNLLGRYDLDVKQNNLMQRGNTIVFIDPVVDRSTGTDDDAYWPAEDEIAPKRSPTDREKAEWDDILRQLSL